MQIMDTLPNLVFLQEYHKKKKQQEKEQKNGQKSKVPTLAKECCDIISKTRHHVKRVVKSAIAVRIVTSPEGCRTEGSES